MAVDRRKREIGQVWRANRSVSPFIGDYVRSGVYQIIEIERSTYGTDMIKLFDENRRITVRISRKSLTTKDNTFAYIETKDLPTAKPQFRMCHLCGAGYIVDLIAQENRWHCKYCGGDN